MKSTRKERCYNWLFLLPSLLGVLVFFVVPFIYSFNYALIDNLGSRNFVGLQNFTDTLTNELFISASRNTLVFIVISVPLGMALALFLASGLRGMQRGKALVAVALLLPVVVPSGATAYFWQILFGVNGLFNRFIIMFGVDYSTLLRDQWTMGFLVVIYLWKNISFNIILFWSGLNWIPNTYYEQMKVDGIGAWRRFRHITLVYLSPTILVVLLISIVNSFKVFREIQMLFGSYPSSDIYMLQHYLNNQFMAMNMAKLSSAAYIMIIALGLVLLGIFYAQKRVTDMFY